MEIGDLVILPDPGGGRTGDIHVYGEIEALDEQEAVVIEAYATHRIWGGSNAQRGRRHRVERQRLQTSLLSNERRITREGMESYHKNPAKWDRQRAEINTAIEGGAPSTTA